MHLSNSEVLNSKINNRLPFFQHQMNKEALFMMYELRNSYITLLNFYQVRTEQFYPLQLQKALSPS